MVKNPRLTFLDTLFSRPLLSSLYLSLKWPKLKKMAKVEKEMAKVGCQV